MEFLHDWWSSQDRLSHVRCLLAAKRIDQKASKMPLRQNIVQKTHIPRIASLLQTWINRSRDADEIEHTLASTLSIQFRFRELVHDIFDTETIEKGETNHHPQATNLRPLLLNALGFNVQRANRGKVQLKLRFDDAKCKDLAFVDGERLVRFLAGLIANAVRFSPAKGCVELRVGTLPGLYRISVIDQGRWYTSVDQDEIGSSTRDHSSAMLLHALGQKLGYRMNFESHMGKGNVCHLDISRIPPVR
ncbi:MAG: hypothetical protein H7833_10720 [Magnetococcus sp. DMHC-1]|nr:hypothetical protein [Magnetococcales bacterium]